MKKIMSLVLALALVLSMGVTVFAADNSTTIDNETGSGSQDVEVKAGYEAGDEKWGGVKYYVTISWNETNGLKYKDNTVTYKWDTTGMKYTAETGTDGAFAGTDAIKVTVKNQSNAAITASCEVHAVDSYTMDTAYGTNGSSFEVGTNAPSNWKDTTTVVTPVEKSTSVTISNVNGTAIKAETKVATLTVTIAKKTEG